MDAIAVYKLDRCKYQVMLVYKVVFTNLAMWVGANNHYSPTSYAHATGSRPVPFFQLSGRIMRDAATVRVELRPFNDCTLNHDLTLLCARVNYIWQRLPDGRSLRFAIYEAAVPQGEAPCILLQEKPLSISLLP